MPVRGDCLDSRESYYFFHIPILYLTILNLTLTGNIATEDRSVFMFSRDTDRGA